MTSRSTNAAAASVAIVETAEQPARKIAHLAAESFTDGDCAVSFVENAPDRWRVAIYCSGAAEIKALRALVEAAAGKAAAKALRIERVAEKDWVRESLAGLAPVAAGRFIVHGAHHRAKIPPNRIGIEIEAALAFGTGHHGTTRGCLLALDRLCRVLAAPRPIARHPEARAKRAAKDDRAARASFKAHAPRGHLSMTELRILDLGTGSGVLAIAAARALRRHVLATDCDGDAVRAARANARLNRAGALIEVAMANGVAGRAVRQRAPYDLVLVNILLPPLKRFAAPLAALTARGGRIVLSGLLRSQANAAVAAYHRLAVERRIDIDGWTTLVMVRR